MSRRRRAGHRHDAGSSLIEVMVTMGLMTIVGAIFTAATLQVYRTTARTVSISTAQSQLQVAFQRLSRELRYASWISEPGQVGTAWYVEFAGFDGTRCGQLRLEAAPSPDGDASDGQGVLRLLSWPQAQSPKDAMVQTVASQLLDPGPGGPFERQGAVDSGFAADRLRIRLTTRVGDSTAEVDTTFTAVNTSDQPLTANPCSQGRPG